MLLNLHVKNLALIEEIEVEFEKGLNILTGETGAGKSIVIGSINLALGAKFDKDMLRNGEESALVELLFHTEDEQVIRKLEDLDIPIEDNMVLITRRLQQGKTINRINGEAVSTKLIKEIGELLIDIHGQHEHQSLLHKKKHMEILDAYGKEAGKKLLNQLAIKYKETKDLEKKIEESLVDEASKVREIALLEFECNEILFANLQLKEDEELEIRYRKMSHCKKITEIVGESYLYTGNDKEFGAGSGLDRGLRLIKTVSEYDSDLQDLEKQLIQIEDLMMDYNRGISTYLSDLEFDEKDFFEVEERLNQVNHLKDKYGNTIGEILNAYKEKQERLNVLAEYDVYMQTMRKELLVKEKELKKLADELSKLRKKNGLELEKLLKDSLKNLNFLTVEFQIKIEDKKEITNTGYDDVEFLISTNPGESAKPLGQVASGGELSRIMLALKTVMADKDDIDTLIFDEIDSGISGKTAWKVSGELAEVAFSHQVICITHLPQIAAMADCQFLIEKNTNETSTTTFLRKVNEQEQLLEIARLLGSDQITDAAISNAKEMKAQAFSEKRRRHDK